MAGNFTEPRIDWSCYLRSAWYFQAAFLLSVRDTEYICETNTADLPSWLALIMADSFFSDMSQFVILATRKGRIAPSPLRHRSCHSF